ncbi:VOC family protein [Hymenobacter monticola]|uniref:VOC family protein n=1 Tax=Hymenobacter monticola TaxID=1705399 RepID=A0ABY4BC74_9BACT|nr:VOC family protein [Hymenobacter monticola]UOE36756.1 VOC family protein [Hymenobacter monticola]
MASRLLTEPAQYIFARDMPATRRWYTALIGFEPIEEDYGLRYDFGTHSLVLSPSGDKGIFGLMVSSVQEARLRFSQAGIKVEETLGTVHNLDGDSASFRDPANNQVMVLEESEKALT